MKNVFKIIIILSLIIACASSKKARYEYESVDIAFNKEEIFEIEEDTTLRQDYIQQAILALRKTGGTLILPKGEIEINGNLRVYGGIQLIGKGADQTILKRGKNNPNDENKGIIEVNGYNGEPILIKNIGFKGYEIEDNNFRDAGIKINNTANFIISNCVFEDFGNAAIGVNNKSWGVIFESHFERIFKKSINNLGYGISVSGDGIWHEDIQPGSEFATFVEDCTFSGCRHVIASNRAARYVFRNNHILEHPISHTVDAHGPGFGSKVGTQWVEIYNNLIENNLVNRDAIMIRGGSGVIYNNIIIKHRHAVHLTLDFDEKLDWETEYPLEWQVQNIWCWGNTLEGLEAKVFVPERSAAYIQEGRDFFIEEKPDYKAFPYPHPLRNIVLEE